MLKWQVGTGSETSGNRLHSYCFKGGGQKPERNFNSLGPITFKDKNSFWDQASIWAVPRIPISKSLNLVAFYLLALKGSSTLSMIHFLNIQSKGIFLPYVCHMFSSSPLASSQHSWYTVYSLGLTSEEFSLNCAFLPVSFVCVHYKCLYALSNYAWKHLFLKYLPDMTLEKICCTT